MTDYSDPRKWFVDLDKQGWFIANHDPEYGDVYGTRYQSRAQCKKALDEIVAGYIASELTEEREEGKSE